MQDAWRRTRSGATCSASRRHCPWTRPARDRDRESTELVRTACGRQVRNLGPVASHGLAEEGISPPSRVTRGYLPSPGGTDWKGHLFGLRSGLRHIRPCPSRQPLRQQPDRSSERRRRSRQLDCSADSHSAASDRQPYSQAAKQPSSQAAKQPISQILKKGLKPAVGQSGNKGRRWQGS